MLCTPSLQHPRPVWVEANGRSGRRPRRWGRCVSRLDALQRTGFALMASLVAMIWPLVATRLNRYLPVEPFLRTNLAAICPPERRSVLVAEASPQPKPTAQAGSSVSVALGGLPHGDQVPGDLAWRPRQASPGY